MAARKPTTITVNTEEQAQLASLQIESLVNVNTGAIVLRRDLLPQVQTAVNALDFATFLSRDILQLGLGAEQALNDTLDGFLVRLDKKTAGEIFKLFRRLEKGVEDAQLPQIAEKVKHGSEPDFLQGLLARIRGIDMEDLIQELSDEVAALISGRTKTLSDEMKLLEVDLESKMLTLSEELKVLDSLKNKYGTHFEDFAVQAAIANGFLAKAKEYVASELSNVQPNDMIAQARIKDLQDKLRLLESRALALEGTYTRLPANQLVIQQIEQAGISTLQETATTLASRFGSIKMTLLALQGTHAVGNVQRISNKQAQVDNQLAKIQADLLKQVAVTAASAPGDNRLAQAQQLESIVASIREIHSLRTTAEIEADKKFEIARRMFAQARQDLSALTIQVTN